MKNISVAAAFVLVMLPSGVSGKTEADWINNGGGSIGLPIFLAIATLLQLAFLYSGFKTLLKQESKAVCLIALVFADFVWAFACFLHCTMNRSKGEFWGGDAGCDAQGYYSALACFSTMFFTMQITYVTHVHASK